MSEVRENKYPLLKRVDAGEARGGVGSSTIVRMYDFFPSKLRSCHLGKWLELNLLV